MCRNLYISSKPDFRSLSLLCISPAIPFMIPREFVIFCAKAVLFSWFLPNFAKSANFLFSCQRERLRTLHPSRKVAICETSFTYSGSLAYGKQPEFYRADRTARTERPCESFILILILLFLDQWQVHTSRGCPPCVRGGNFVR